MNITNSEFTRNDGGAVYIESNNTLITNTEFNYNSDVIGGALQVVSGVTSQTTVLTVVERLMLSQAVCPSPTVS